MKQLIFTMLGIACLSTGFTQDKKKIAAIVDEGKKLYRSEMASWYGTDVFLEQNKELKEQFGGYFSYVNNDKATCVFYSKGEEPGVISTITFDSSYDVAAAVNDRTARTFTKTEQELYQLREKATAIIQTDTFFKQYKNTSLNIIPLVMGKEKKVYVLTGTSANDVVLFGNDYLLLFDKDNSLLEKKRLHKNIIPVKYGKKDEKVLGTMHTHQPETGEYITPTDICTLMLYGKLTGWDQHIVVSETYMSIWDCKKNDVVVITKQAWDKIYGNQEKKDK